MSQSDHSLARIWGRRFIIVLTGLYLVLALLLLVLRFAVLPHLDHFKPRISAYLSSSLGMEVSLASIDATWHGWSPVFKVRDLQLISAQGGQQLLIPALEAGFDARALLQGRSGVLRLQVHSMELDVQRLADGNLSVLGRHLAGDGPGGSDNDRVLPWLLAQPLIEFRDSTLRWHDQLRNAPVLELEQLQALMSRTDNNGLAISLSANAAQAGNSRLELQLQLNDVEGLMQGSMPHQWQAWLQLANIEARLWNPWFELPGPLRQAHLGLQAWVDADGDDPQLTIQAALADLQWSASADEHVLVPEASLWARGPWSQWNALSRAEVAAQGLEFQLRTQDIQLSQPFYMEHALDLGLLSASGSLRHEGSWALALDDLVWRNRDIELQGSGSWHSGGMAGDIDMGGTIRRARLDAIHRYLPLEVNPDARQWLAGGLLGGELLEARWLLQGKLEHFPFGERPDAGDFLISGSLHDAAIEFVPGASPGESWPRLLGIMGNISLHRMDLGISASQASMQPLPGAVISMRDLQARIPDLEHDATLHVSGHTSASGSTYMALIQNSPLNAMLGHVLADAGADGSWQVPLELTVPLMHSIDTEVSGSVLLEQASLRLLPDAPAFRQIRGNLGFTEQGLHIDKALQASLLGGSVRISGGLGGPQAAGLQFEGSFSAQALADYVGVPGMQRISGGLEYTASVIRQKDGYVARLFSDTTGLELDFPAPVAKPAQQARRLEVHWSDTDASDDVLDIRYGDSLRLAMRHRRGDTRGPYFRKMAVGLGQMPDDPADGMQLSISYPLFDLDLWNRIVDEFSIPRRNQPAARKSRQLWPDLRLLSVQADQLRLLGTRLDQAVLRAVSTAEEFWSLNVHSRQTSGTMKWQERNGRVIGRVSGNFDTLSLGDDTQDTLSLLPETEDTEPVSVEDDLDIPGIILHARQLRIYGHSLGGLVLEGERDAMQGLWQLHRLRIGNDDALLRGTGTWRLRDPGRGLSIKASVQVEDMGSWLAEAGWPDLLWGGKGTLKGSFNWHNLPWSYEKQDLLGDLRFELDQGRFQKLGSHSAKLLEILSLQSIFRLGKLEQGLTGLHRDGFPFDQLRGSVSMRDGILKAHDYKIIGPAGTILLEGDSNVIDETLNLQAVVVPNLDVSGAAVAAGIAINPLIGLGAFVTQWLLKSPMARAMTVRYHISGPWSDPHISDVPVESHDLPAGQAPDS